MSGLSILSLGSTRGLWDGPDSEDVRRLSDYGTCLDYYCILTHSLKAHQLKRMSLAPHIDCIPTDAIGGFHSFLKMLWIGAGVLKKRRIALIQAQDPFFLGVAAVLLGRRYHLPVNVCIYGPNIYDPHWLSSHWSHQFLKPIARWVMRACDSIQTDGQMTVATLMKAGYEASKIHLKAVVPMNLQDFLLIDRGTPSEREPIRILYAGRLAVQKDLMMLFDALELAIHEGARPFVLLIAGRGPEEARLRARVQSGPLSKRVEFLGNVDRKDLPALFASVDLFVLTSRFEGYPRVLMEAAAAALPIVTTAVSGSDEAVLDGVSGYRVPVGVPAAFAEKLALLIDNRALRLEFGNAARTHIQECLDPASNTPRQVAIWKGSVSRYYSPTQGDAEFGDLLLFNLVTDIDHPILGFTTQWICELARRSRSVEVITMAAGKIDVPANVRVHSVGRELGYSELRRTWEFYRLLFAILRRSKIEGCFSHMTPEFSILAGPVLRAKRIPLVTWYAHPSLNWRLKMAHLFSNQMVASVFNAYPWRKDKFTVIGQGIDTNLFSPNGTQVHPNRVLCVGRISPVKDHATLLRAAALLDSPVEVMILGKAASSEDEENLRNLKALGEELGISHQVKFEPPVVTTQLPEWYRSCTIHVNLTPQGFGDKVAWEAMACGRPCLVANEDFRETLGRFADELLFRFNDPADLALKLSALWRKSPVEQAEIGAYLRSQVERLHCLPRMAERVLGQIRRFTHTNH